MAMVPGKIGASVIGAMGVVLWATETTLVTYTTGIPPLETVAIAFAFAAAMSPIVWWITGSHPLLAFRQPLHVWILTVGSLVGYHACIYYATQKAPPAAAALLQGTTPLMIVLGSALLPGEKLRWWHVVGAVMGLGGIVSLIDVGGENDFFSGGFYLSLIGIAAGLWGLYSVLTRALPEVPSSALGVFYGASAVISFAAHFGTEIWVQPTDHQWIAMALLGILPMGLAIYFWDFGLKRGDIQALGAFSYVEPFIGAVLVALFTSATLDLSLLWSGILVVGGAVLASASLWKRDAEVAMIIDMSARHAVILHRLSQASSRDELHVINNQILERLVAIGHDFSDPRKHDEELRNLLMALDVSIKIFDGLDESDDQNAMPLGSNALVA
jgi:drug/metabolite transporter (DMT)-like permease